MNNKEKDLYTRCPYHCNEKIGQCNNPSQETPHTYCIDNKDCIYKQYARKEQKCEELKVELEAVYDDCKGCSICNEALYNANLYAKEYRKLKQTLTEIKEIAEDFGFNGIYEDCFTGIQKILQKINECEINNEC